MNPSPFFPRRLLTDYRFYAIRMMTDIGLHLHTKKVAELEKLTAAEIETRNRLYCSAFIWDKTLVLSLGCLPSLTMPPRHSEMICTATSSIT